MPFYTYIMLCNDGSYYTGHTDDVEKRFRLHRAGFGGRYTRIHPPIEVLHVEEFATRGEAVRRELELKAYGRDGREKVVRSKFDGVKWVFFDLGSTLTDESVFERFMFREIYRFLLRSGVQASRRRFNHVVRDAINSEKYRKPKNVSHGTAYQMLLSNVIKTLPGGENLVEDAIEHYLNFIRPVYPKKQRLRKEARAVLKALAKKYSLGLVCNQPNETRDLLRKFGIEHLFKVIVLSEEVGVNKPDKKIFLLALSLAQCTPDQAVIIGDRLDNDVAPAKKLGMKTVHVKLGLAAGQKPLCNLEKADCSLFNLKSLLEVL